MPTRNLPFTHGAHICALYDTEGEQIAIATEYLSDGLRRGERCYYVGASPAALRRFRTALRRAGVDADAHVKRCALVEATHGQAHLAGGAFDCEAMLRRLNGLVDAALKDGFSGLRTCGDMTWLIGKPSGCQHVVEYEAHLNDFFRGLPAQGMCQYDRRRMPVAVINDALATHSSIFVERQHHPNPLYRSSFREAR